MFSLRFGPIALLALLAACSGGGGGNDRPAIELVTGLPTTGGERLVDFGLATLGETRERRIAFENRGEREETLRMPALEAPFAAEWAGEPRLAPGERRELVLRFTASDENRREALLGVTAGIALRLTGAGARCSFDLDLERLDFGASQPGFATERRVTIRNVGEAACTLESATTEGSSAFSVEPPQRLVIRPGTSYALSVRFQPIEGMPQFGELRLRISGAEAKVSLHGEAGENCFRTDLVEYDFGTIGVGCGGGNQLVNVVNDCAAPVTIEQVAVEPANGPFVLWSGSPRVLEPGGSSWFSIRFQPEVEGTYEASLQLLGAGGVRAASAVLRGSGGPSLAPARDSYFAPSQPPVDVLVVVDDSEAMASFEVRLERFVEDLVEALRGRDFRLAVTGTSLVGTEDCPASGGALVESVGSPDVLDPSVANWAGLIARRVALQRCHPASETGALEAAWRAVDPGAAGGQLFPLREDGWLWLIVLAPGEEHSPVEPAVYADRFERLRARETQLPWLTVDAWTGPGSCSAASDGSRLGSFVSRLGGTVHGICRTLWDRPFVPFGSAQRSYWVTNWPVDKNGDGQITEAAGEISLLVDGEPVPQLGENGLRWNFQPASASVDLLLPVAPQGGETVTLTYDAWCPGGGFEDF